METARPFGDPRPAVRVGKVQPSQGTRDRSARSCGALDRRRAVRFTRRARSAEVLRVDLGGMRVVLARCPRLLPTTDRPPATSAAGADRVGQRAARARGCGAHRGPASYRAKHGQRHSRRRRRCNAGGPGGGAPSGRPPARLKRYIGPARAAHRAADRGRDRACPVETAGACRRRCVWPARSGRASPCRPSSAEGAWSPFLLFHRHPVAAVIHGEGELPLLLCLGGADIGRWAECRGCCGRTGRGDVESNHQVFHDLDVRARLDLRTCRRKGTTRGSRGGASARDPTRGRTARALPVQRGAVPSAAACNSFGRRTYRLLRGSASSRDPTHAVRTGVHRFYMVNHLLNADPAHLWELVERLEAARLTCTVDSCRVTGMSSGAAAASAQGRPCASRLAWTAP